jgi:hypothetical protein
MFPQWFKGARLQPLAREAKWYFSFTNEQFVLESTKEPLPSDLKKAFLGPDQSASRIEGKWRLEDGNRTLVFSDLRIDGKEKSGEVKLAIEPAGPIRVNLGDHQYNVIPGEP